MVRSSHAEPVLPHAQAAVERVRASYGDLQPSGRLLKRAAAPQTSSKARRSL